MSSFTQLIVLQAALKKHALLRRKVSFNHIIIIINIINIITIITIITIIIIIFIIINIITAPDFKKFNAKVFGVSSGNAADKEKFIKTNKLNSFDLLIDAGDKLRTSWKVPRALFGAFPGRVTYIIDKSGKVVSVYDDLGNAEGHPLKALEVLATLKK